MMDREKVIKALEHCKDNQHVNDCNKCDYGGKTGMFCIRMIDDVLALLKEQEAKPPAIMQDINGVWSTCSMCGHKLRPILAIEMDTYFPKFCSECGQAVKWE